MRISWIPACAVLGALAAYGQTPECSYFGRLREQYARAALHRAGLSTMTRHVAGLLPLLPGGVRDRAPSRSYPPGSIDAYIFGDLEAAGVAPADPTTDYEFIRRVTLDLTARIPIPDRAAAFAASQAPDKRSRLVEELLQSPQWVDKWTMFFGDLYKNTAYLPSSGVNRFAQGRNAFYQWIHDSLAAGKPYNQMATELIATAADNSYQSGPVNWLVGGVVSGGPGQDIIDQQAANVAGVFLGISHMNCLLCHNGRGHLDQISLWGSRMTRAQAWQFASFLSHTSTARKSTGAKNVYYWAVLDNVARDYTLGTTSGNRPARTPLPSCAAGKLCTVAPVYPFGGGTPQKGESYRQALAAQVTGDPQFARAAVNYVWAQFFGRGIVDPPDQFDPARLDPNDPPPAPWTLQPTDANLLNALAQRFIDGGYDLRSLMREIANSDAYQLSSRYEGNWDPAWEPLFARHFVRRLWAEEIHDAVVQSSGLLPSYAMTGFTDQGYPKLTWAMQFPDTMNTPLSPFLASFLRGNRDDQPRKGEGSVLQALNLMNDPFIEQHIQPRVPLLVAVLALPDEQAVQSLYLNVLSRPPSGDELSAALAALRSGSRPQAARNLLWALYNKVDFVFNY